MAVSVLFARPVLHTYVLCVAIDAGRRRHGRGCVFSFREWLDCYPQKRRRNIANHIWSMNRGFQALVPSFPRERDARLTFLLQGNQRWHA
jgi:hypothetical protein